MEKEKIKALIANGKLEKAIDEIILHINLIEDIDEKNDFILQSSRFKRIIREKNLGVETPENINITINQITTAVLSMLDSFEDKIPSESILESQQKKKGTKKLILGSLISISLFLVAIITYKNYFQERASLSKILEKK